MHHILKPIYKKGNKIYVYIYIYIYGGGEGGV